MGSSLEFIFLESEEIFDTDLVLFELFSPEFAFFSVCSVWA